ncbi:MAG TPA: transcription antitermination factor NusB [Candidatus Hypogeohydataceae bacterium YC38]|nr:transcription antitermination factor NusB [Candidatus Brocadiales bacterium]
MRKRTRARELALQALYQIEVRGEEALEDALSFCAHGAGDTEVSQFASQLVEGCRKGRRVIDEEIASVVENWELPRMATIDRCILRLSVYELLYREDIPPKVSINEAIELAKKYSTEKSGNFVNGVLDKIYERHQETKASRSTSSGLEEPLITEYGEADLHVHTICSDGTSTPEEVVEEAARIGLKTVGITDHDSIEAIRPAQRAGLKKGVHVIPGIELSGYYEPSEVHILGLFINIEDKALLDKLQEMRRDRVSRVSAMVEKLRPLGIKIEAQEILDVAGGSPPGRMHVAEALLKKGYCADYQEAFQRYIGDEGPAYVPKKTITPQEAVELILCTGGAPVYTHPGLTKRDDLIPHLVESGIQAIEVYYPNHTPEMVERYLRIAKQYDLLVTGGSDFHGLRKPNVPLGRVRVPSQLVVALRERCLQRRSATVAL